VGTVWLALAVADASRGPQLSAQRLQLAGDRAAVRHATVVAALQALLRSI
jgi:nicotinamide mononucleotide (NMN) deamidase PncC